LKAFWFQFTIRLHLKFTRCWNSHDKRFFFLERFLLKESPKMVNFTKAFFYSYLNSHLPPKEMQEISFIKRRVISMRFFPLEMQLKPKICLNLQKISFTHPNSNNSWNWQSIQKKKLNFTSVLKVSDEWVLDSEYPGKPFFKVPNSKKI